MSLAGVDAEVSGLANLDLGLPHTGAQTKAQSWPGARQSDGPGSAQTEPQSFLSSWKSQLAALTEGDSTSLVSALATASLPSSASSNSLIPSKLPSKTASPLEESADVSTIRSGARTGKGEMATWRQLLADNKTTAPSMLASSPAVEHKSNSFAIWHANSLSHIKENAHDRTQQPATDGLSNIVSFQAVPIAVPVSHLPEKESEIFSPVASASQEPLPASPTADAGAQTEMHRLPAVRESIASSAKTIPATSDESPQRNMAPVRTDEAVTRAVSPDTDSSPRGTRAPESISAEPARPTLPSLQPTVTMNEHSSAQQDRPVRAKAEDFAVDSQSQSAPAISSDSVQYPNLIRSENTIFVSPTTSESLSNQTSLRTETPPVQPTSRPIQLDNRADGQSQNRVPIQADNSQLPNKVSPSGDSDSESVPFQPQPTSANTMSLVLTDASSIIRGPQVQSGNSTNPDQVVRIRPIGLPSIQPSSISKGSSVLAIEAVTPKLESASDAEPFTNSFSFQTPSLCPDPASAQPESSLANPLIVQTVKPTSSLTPANRTSQAMDPLEVAPSKARTSKFGAADTPHVTAPRRDQPAFSHTTHPAPQSTQANPLIHPTQQQTVGQFGDSSVLLRDPVNIHTTTAAGADPRSNIAQTPTSSASETFAKLDSSTQTDTPTWVHAGPHRAEAGFQDPSLGWVGVRADASGGQVHATVVPASADAVQQLGGHLAGLHSYLAETRAPVDSLSLATPASRELPFSTTQDQGQAMNQDARQNRGHGNSADPAPVPLVSSFTSSNAEVLGPTVSPDNPHRETYGRSGAHISVIA